MLVRKRKRGRRWPQRSLRKRAEICGSLPGAVPIHPAPVLMEAPFAIASEVSNSVPAVLPFAGPCRPTITGKHYYYRPIRVNPNRPSAVSALLSTPGRGTDRWTVGRTGFAVSGPASRATCGSPA